MQSFDIAVENAILNDDLNAVLVKLSNDLLELNIYFHSIEIAGFLRFIDRVNNEIKAGLSANSPVYWKRENEDICLLIGDDMEVWDICVMLKQTTLTQIQQHLKQL